MCWGASASSNAVCGNIFSIVNRLSVDYFSMAIPQLSPCLLGSVQAEHGAVAGQEVGIRTGVGNLNWIGEIEKYLALDDKNISANLHPTNFAHFPDPDGHDEG